MIPEWLEARQLTDEAFEAAYASVPPKGRALIKTAIASLYAWLEPAGLLSKRTQAITGQGVSISTLISPRKWAVVHIPAHCSDPALLVGAVLPLLAAGVWPVSAVLEEKGLHRQGAIPALELCGVETVYAVPPEMMDPVLRHWMDADAGGPGIVVCIDHGPAPGCGTARASSGRQLVVNLPRPQKAGIWLKEGEFDLQALSWMHPGLECSVWMEEERELPPGFRPVWGQWSDFIEQSVDAAWVPGTLMHRALNVFSLVLGPGQEPVWIWPWYVPALAGHTHVGIASASELEGKDNEGCCER